MALFGISETVFFGFLMILLRMAALFSFAPVFSSPSLPTVVKSSIILSFSVCLASAGVSAPIPQTLALLLLMAAREILIGILLGFAANLIFAAIQLSGQIIGMDMGLGIVSVMDPQFEAQVSIISQFQVMAAILLFLAVGGHLKMVEVFSSNLAVLPPGRVIFSEQMLESLIYLTGEIFSVGLRLAAPIMATLFAVNVILGIFARSVPQMNMLILGFPLKIFTGFTLLGMSMPYVFKVLIKQFSTVFEALDGLSSLLFG